MTSRNTDLLLLHSSAITQSLKGSQEHLKLLSSSVFLLNQDDLSYLLKLKSTLGPTAVINPLDPFCGEKKKAKPHVEIEKGINN